MSDDAQVAVAKTERHHELLKERSELREQIKILGHEIESLKVHNDARCDSLATIAAWSCGAISDDDVSAILRMPIHEVQEWRSSIVKDAREWVRRIKE